MFLLWFLAASNAALSPTEEIVACMTEESSGHLFVSKGQSWLIQDNPGLTEPGGMMYTSRRFAANLREFESMWEAITACAKQGGDLTPIKSGSYKLWAPSGRPLYTVYTQKQGCIEEYGEFKHRVLIVGDWARRAELGRYPCNLSEKAKTKFVTLLNDAYDLWQEVFDFHPTSISPPISESGNYGANARKAQQSSKARNSPDNTSRDKLHTLDQEYHMKESDTEGVFDKEETWSKKERREKTNGQEMLSARDGSAQEAPVSPVVYGFAAVGLGYLLYGAFRFYFGKHTY